MKSAELCDVVVVGAGLAGTLIARRLAEENQRVIILEATDTIGGSSIKSTGVALLGTPELYPTLAERLGEDLAAQVWMLTQKNLESLRRTAQAMGVSVSKVGSLRLTDRDNEVTLFQKAAIMLNAIGVDIILEDAADEGFLVGLHTTDDLAFEPEALIQSLIDHPNIDVHTRTEVQKLTPRADDLAIWAHKYYHRAETVVLAGGAYTIHRHQELGKFMHPQLIQTIDCDPVSNVTLPLILPGNAHSQVIVKNTTTSLRMVTYADTQKEGWQRLTQTAVSMCRNTQEQEALLRGRWSGWAAESEDALPLIGEVPGLPGVYTINGLGPWGLSWVFIAADLLVDLILKKKTPPLLDISRLYS
jgi:glycine/D-amino acid oxidase-like deaminating enzyme